MGLPKVSLLSAIKFTTFRDNRMIAFVALASIVW
jgi:hypothetical protein